MSRIEGLSLCHSHSGEASGELAEGFLRDVENGVEWDSLFLSAVLNSVPFLQDRLRVLCILAACYSPKTKGAFISANSIYNTRWQNIASGGGLGKKDVSTQAFAVDYEQGTLVGDLSMGKPKVQKFHTAEEFTQLLSVFWDDVKTGYYNRYVTKGVGRRVKPVNQALLRSALAFEFNLLYPDGLRLGMHNRAIKAFNQRLKLDMPLFTEDALPSDDEMWKALVK